MTDMTTSTAPVALVTGAGKRIGAAIVRALHARGMRVAVHCHRSRAEADALVAELNHARADSAVVLQADLGDLAALPALIDACVDTFGRLDALINNASTFDVNRIGSTTPAQWDAAFSANARAPYFLAQAAQPHLAAQQGCIVNLVDVYVARPLREHSLYVMAKAALEAMTRALAIELAPDIRVNAVAPGAILWPESPQAVDANADYQADIIARTPLKRAGTPEEIASAVAWLVLDASFTTGETLRLDGGRMLTP